MPDSVMTRFFGGSPLTVAVRLVVVSLLVGLVMTWLEIDPMDVVLEAQRGFVRLWGTGFVALHRIGRTVATGAALVLPVWFVLRVLSYRGPRPHPMPHPEATPEPAPRWRTPDRVETDPRA